MAKLFGTIDFLLEETVKSGVVRFLENGTPYAWIEERAYALSPILSVRTDVEGKPVLMGLPPEPESSVLVQSDTSERGREEGRPNQQWEHYYETHPLPEDDGTGPVAVPVHPNHKEMPNPTSEQLNDPAFNAIWTVIKSWDVNAPEYYSGYCGANGSHVMLIWNALKAVERQHASTAMDDLRTLVFLALGEASMCWSEIPKGVFNDAHAIRIGDRIMGAISSEMDQVDAQRVDPETALYAFMGWLTSRDGVAGPFSARHEAGQAAELIKAFCEAQGWQVDSEKYLRQIKHLKTKYPDGYTRSHERGDEMNTEDQLLAAGGQKLAAEPDEAQEAMKREMEARLQELQRLAEVEQEATMHQITHRGDMSKRPRLRSYPPMPEEPTYVRIAPGDMEQIRILVREEVQGIGHAHLTGRALEHLHEFLASGKCPVCGKLQHEVFLTACAMTHNGLPVIPTHLCECRPENPQTSVPANHVFASPHPKGLQEKFLRMGWGTWVPTPGVEDEDKEVYLTINGEHFHVMSVEEALSLSDDELKRHMEEAMNARQGVVAEDKRPREEVDGQETQDSSQ